MATQVWFSSFDPPALFNTVGIGVGGYPYSAGDNSRAISVGADTIPFSALVGGMVSAVKTGSGSTYPTTSVTGPTAGKIVDPNASINPAVLWVSDPLAADVTISGTISFALCASEGSMSANATIGCAILRMDSTGAFTTIISSTAGTELGTSIAKSSWTGTPTSTACKKGDRLVFVPYYDDATATTMGNGFTLTFGQGGSLANVRDSNVSFTETITFLTSFSAGTTYYVRDTASDLAGSGQKALSTTQGSGTVTATYTTVNGPLTYPGNRVTATSGGTQLEWFTPQLNAFTLGGAVKVDLGCQTPAAFRTSGKYFTFLEIAICDSDGSNATVWARNWYSTVDSVFPPGIIPHYLTGPDTSVGQGKRLRFRIYIDDLNSPAAGDTNQSSGTDVVYRYDGTSTYATAVNFTQTITEATLVDPPANVANSLRKKRRFNPLWIR